MVMTSARAAAIRDELRHPGIREVHRRWSGGFPTCMGGILPGRTVRGAGEPKLL